jgi:hypothetical protein
MQALPPSEGRKHHHPQADHEQGAHAATNPDSNSFDRCAGLFGTGILAGRVFLGHRFGADRSDGLLLARPNTARIGVKRQG